jgi:hypothetical protein
MFSTLERNIFDVVTYMEMSEVCIYLLQKEFIFLSNMCEKCSLQLDGSNRGRHVTCRYKFVFKTFKSLLKVEWL